MRISIKAKLAGGFGIMLVLTGLAGGVGYQQLIAADDAMRFVVERSEVQNRVLAAQALAIRAVSNTRATVISTTDEQMTHFAERASRFRAEALEELGTVKPLLLNEEAWQLLDAAVGKFDRQRALGSRVVELTRLNSAARTWAHVDAAARPTMVALRTELLDLELPRMDGLTFLRKITAQRPIPVIVCSTLTEAGSQTLFDVLEAGAVDVVPKPRIDTRQFLVESSVRVCDAVRAAAKAKLRPGRPEARRIEKKLTADAVLPAPARNRAVGETERIVCIGASTGGTEALRDLLEEMPQDCPGLIVVQHKPEHFTAAFARRLDGLCAIAVKEAEDGDAVLPGRALIAPGGRHLLLQRIGNRYSVSVKDGPLVSRHRPSVDVLFRATARCAGANALGILMTGMGDDGATGLLEMRHAGALTVAQDEDSCVVFGMPEEAIERGAAAKVLPLDRMHHEIVRFGAAPTSRQPA